MPQVRGNQGRSRTRRKIIAGSLISGFLVVASAFSNTFPGSLPGRAHSPGLLQALEITGAAEAKSNVSFQISITAPARELGLEDLLFLSAMAAFWGMDVDVIAQYYGYYPSGIQVHPVPPPSPVFAPTAYVQFASVYYCVPEAQVWAWLNMGIPAPELTMCLNIAARARVSPSMVIRLRRSGASWQAIARRYRIPESELSKPVVPKGKHKGKKWK
ncbi:MAG TPA: hypothetical protein GX506_11400 [Firmicutes bacterium]|nr:hypothetical protein [Bacillota bacterium]